MARVTDMTKGSTTRHILWFALPLLLGNLFQQFYNLVDSIVVGKHVGEKALAAVGACGSLNFLFFSLSSGLSIGVGVIVAQYFGAGEERQIKRSIINAIYVIVVTALLFSFVACIFAPQILRLLSTPEDVIGNSIVYMRITCTGLLAVALYNCVASVLRALGDSRTPLIFLIIASFINVGFDLLFVLVFEMGVAGVAWATFISQVISAITAIIYAVLRVEYFQIKRSEISADGKLLRNIIRIGVPISLQSSMIAISCIFLQKAVNGFGPAIMAAFTITSRIESLVQQPYQSLSAALTTYSGQNMGAGNIERVKKGLRSATVMALLFSLAMLPVAYIFGEPIAHLFAKEPEVIKIGAKALRITSICYFPLGMIYVPRAVLNGAGDAQFAMINGISEVVCRIFFSTVLTKIAFIGYWGVWATSGATWTVTAIVCMMRYFQGGWKKKGITQKA
ncbi:MATE family efflux transporter [[Clostridium] polysaccharolyticum]|uniref:Probable multidrug resistance protein NorM n=1 Tax=[Clostridium] polysaccharolyticum TaxID=29364 RepID=A0A1I0CRQ0_9FIRM|nr:MATE family efflux transporter [[Clostridium] polysaccharolyticum]SET22351.1 putative efflux protein, MATE family [[Clostridium] polysaccharolyticum]